MNESHRKAYLNAMGIDVYYSRVILPAAKVSPNYEFAVEEETQSLATKKNESEKFPEIKRSAVTQTISNVPIRDKEAVPHSNIGYEDSNTQTAGELSEELPEGASPVVSEDGTLRFAIKYYKITENLAVIEEYPLQQSVDLDKESLNLLRNILRALGIETEHVVFTPEYLSWPLVEGLSTEVDDIVAAKRVLQGFIAGRQKQDGFKNLLVFAGLIDDLLIGPDDAQNRRDYQVQGTEYSIIVTHSLQSMLSNPQLKKDVWRRLQALLTRIQATS